VRYAAISILLIVSAWALWALVSHVVAGLVLHDSPGAIAGHILVYGVIGSGAVAAINRLRSRGCCASA